MSRHDDLLNQGPHEAPEPETAEEKSRKLGLKTAGGAVAGGGAVAAKVGAIGGVGQVFLFVFLLKGGTHTRPTAARGCVPVWRLEGELRKAHAQAERRNRQLQTDGRNVHKQSRRDRVVYREERHPERT